MRTWMQLASTTVISVSAMCFSDASYGGDPLKTEVVCVKHEVPITLSMLKGRYAAVHVLPSMSSTSDHAFVEMLVKRSPELAGVYHVVVAPCQVNELAALGDLMTGTSVTVGCDADHELRESLGIAKDNRGTVTVLLGKDGAELDRLNGKGDGELPNFDAIAELVKSKTRNDAIDGYNLPKGSTLAVEGYDLVSYFTQNTATKGKQEFASYYRGVEYRFASLENRKLFADRPEKYLPTYGGWCASAMGAKGTKVEIDPTNFKVKDGRLFLFYKSVFGDALKDWNKHEQEWEPAADTNWEKLSGEKPTARPVDKK